MDNINAMMRLRRCSIGGILYKYTEYGIRSYFLENAQDGKYLIFKRYKL